MYSPYDTFQQFEYKEHDKYLLKNGIDGFLYTCVHRLFFPDHVFANR